MDRNREALALRDSPVAGTEPVAHVRLDAAGDDERAAAQLRRRYRLAGLPRLDIDADLRHLLRSGETAVDVHPGVRLTRHPTGAPPRSAAGPLLVTTHRLVLSCVPDVSVDLTAVRELEVTDRLLLITLRDGTGVQVETGRPRMLRAQIAEVIAARRG